MRDVRHATRLPRPVTEADGKSLPYRIELWDAQQGRVERVLARAARLPLARAIFRAARDEYPGRQITLRRGERLISEAITTG